jgi:NAD(P)-dependent dehydrogenase (short-subunit alcohol dehydrogenase family)
MNAFGRLGEAQDAGRAIAFLCSPAAAWTTGQLIFSDGGYSLA